MNNLIIIIPVLNEIKYLPVLFERLSTYPKPFKLLFLDPGSTDGSTQYIKLNLVKLENINAKLVEGQIDSPSILKTLSLAPQQDIDGKYIFIHPVDINAQDTLSKILSGEPLSSPYYIVHKSYDEGHILLKLQQWVLNKIRIDILNQFVWTNAPILKANDYLEITKCPSGFLEDVIASDYLRSKYSAGIIRTPVIVSSRKYTKDGVLTRLIGNIYIMIMYRLNLKTIPQLKEIYHKKP
jgi:glycosyltransferase involved in cell wall biosynthesis